MIKTALEARNELARLTRELAVAQRRVERMEAACRHEWSPLMFDAGSPPYQGTSAPQWKRVCQNCGMTQYHERGAQGYGRDNRYGCRSASPAEYPGQVD